MSCCFVRPENNFKKKTGILKARKQKFEPGRSKALTPCGSVGFGCCGGCSAPTWVGVEWVDAAAKWGGFGATEPAGGGYFGDRRAETRSHGAGFLFPC